MPYVGHQTACDFELVERSAQGARFGNSRVGRRAALVMLSIAAVLGTALIYQGIRARGLVLQGSLGAGAIVCALSSLGLLYRTMTCLELRTDRAERTVTLRKRRPFLEWSVSWQLHASQVVHVLLARDGDARTAGVVLTDGRNVNLDEGRQVDFLESLAKELSETFCCPIREA